MSDASRSETRPPEPSPRHSHRLLLRAYPGWFREEFASQLLAYLACQRREARYGRRGLGAALFWWDAGRDALLTGARLRLERLFERRARQPGRRGSRPAGIGHLETGGLGVMLDATIRDLRHALRGLSRNPGYAFVFILTLGLGIGANTAMFSAVNGVLLRPLPHEDGDRLVYLRHSAREAGLENVLFSVPEVEDFRRGTRSLEAVAEFSTLSFTMLGHGAPRRLRAGIVTGNYFGVMGLSATLGRTVGPEDDGASAAPVIVLSDKYWRAEFAADLDVLGKTVEITGAGSGRTATIVGVAEPAPPYPERTDIYVNLAASPHHLDATMSHDRTHRMTEVFARLAPGATVETVLAEAGAVSARIHAEHPEAYDTGAGFQVSVTPLKTQLTSRARPTLLLLLGTALAVLIIACANLANLTLTRVLRRDHELAVRASLGASRSALRRQLLVESLVLAGAGAALGLLLASLGLDLLVAFAERFTSRASEITFDATVFGFALLVAVAASVFFTVLPALPEGDSAVAGLRRSGSRATAGSGSRRAQRTLVVAQIATSFVLLIGAGLLLRTMMHLSRVDPGFDTVRVLTMDIPVDMRNPPATIRSRYRDVVEEVRALPGVENAALTSWVPLSGASSFSGQMQMRVDGHEPLPGAPLPRANFRVVQAGYFATMGIDLVRGREFTVTDVADAQQVLVINEAMARAYFGERDPIGGRIAWTDDNFRFMGVGPEWRTVVGVAADTRDGGLDAEVMHTVYNPYEQVTPYATGSMVVRATANPAALLPAIRRVILSRLPEQPIDDVATLAELGSASVAPLRLNALLLSGFAFLALVIAAVGLGGVLAFSVGSRTREFGVRSAVGAARHQIWSGVLAEGTTMAAVGIALGAVAAVVLTRFLAWLLVGVRALDPVTFIAVAVLLGGVAIAAAWAPAWRAARVSPMEALRAE